MAYGSFSFPGFGGINLRDSVDVVEPNAAIDCLNVLFTNRGAIKQRPGYAKFTQVEGTNRYDSLGAYYSSGAKHLVVGAGNRLEAIDTTGTIVATSTAPTASPHYFARLGTPSSERLYIANGTDVIRYWDGTAFTTQTGTNPPAGKFVAVEANDNRLVNARFVGTTAGHNQSSVRFSDPGDPATWGVNNYVDLTPGDGEEIMGVCSYQELTFVFKETKFFVYYGTSVASGGTPVFNYRVIDTGVGLASSRALCVGRDGVYFLDRKGLYRTTGEAPTLISGIIDPIFYGGASDFYQGGVLSHAAISNSVLTWHEERIYLSYTSGDANDRTLVFDPRYDWWSLYDFPAAALCSFRISDQAELVFAYASGLKHLGRHSPSYTSDDGVATTARWRSGWFNLKSSEVKALREHKAWGYGQCEFGISKDFRVPVSKVKNVQFGAGIRLWGDGTDSTDLWGDGTDTNNLWGPATTIRPKLVRLGSRGTTFSVQFRNATLDRTFEIHRLTTYVSEMREPSVVEA